MKKIEIVPNAVGGLDLLTERGIVDGDSGNDVRILTGKKELSLDFWTRMKGQAEAAIEYLKPFDPLA